MTISISRHPGGMIRRRFMNPMHLTMTDLANALGVSVSSVSRVVNEKADISGDMALRLSYVLGGSAETWLTLQMNYNLDQARKTFDASGLGRISSIQSTPE